MKDFFVLRSWAETESVSREQQVKQNRCAANLCETRNLKTTETLWVAGVVETLLLASGNMEFCQVNQALYLLGDLILPPMCVVGSTCTAPQHTVLHC